jgi:hypothetical protein
MAAAQQAESGGIYKRLRMFAAAAACCPSVTLCLPAERLRHTAIKIAEMFAHSSDLFQQSVGGADVVIAQLF